MSLINIQKRLHHRAPYLLIDEVVNHSDKKIHAIKVATMKEDFLKGHFPHAPIVPGAMMQEMTTQAAGLLIAEHYSPVEDYDSENTKGHALGVLRTIHKAKYKHFARPYDVLNIHVELTHQIQNSFRFIGKIEVNGEVIMQNEFTLMNITEDQLAGQVINQR